MNKIKVSYKPSTKKVAVKHQSLTWHKQFTITTGTLEHQIRAKLYGAEACND